MASTPDDIRETVRARYAAAATHSAAGSHEQAQAVETSCCSAPPVATTDAHGDVVFGAELYGPELTAALADAGFTQVEIRPTHRVHAHAQAAIIRAVLPTTVLRTQLLGS